MPKNGIPVAHIVSEATNESEELVSVANASDPVREVIADALAPCFGENDSPLDGADAISAAFAERGWEVCKRRDVAELLGERTVAFYVPVGVSS